MQLSGAPGDPARHADPAERINRRGPECLGARATRIDLDYESKREKVAVAEQTWSSYELQDDRSANRERSERRYESQRSLSMWESRRDDRKQKAARSAQRSGTP
ncbi:hypothetical protein [Sphingomonas psychrotolerans]|uniref:hypothetical protein n=1 Tax=Sphingomonas psychrotolerans TaxID=1327635 RepID=UPI00130529E6|nr:hypothetical protein [Sphingomonas psychrotolerans]